MTSDFSERDLVRRCREGDRSAWEEFVRRYYDELFAEAQNQGATPEKADWAVETAFDTVFAKHLAHYETNAPQVWPLSNVLSVNVAAALHPRWGLCHESHFG